VQTLCRPTLGEARGRGKRVTALAVIAALAAPAVAHAHGLNVDGDPNRALIQYVILGFEHMALGWDHLLFIIGTVLLAPNGTMAAKLVSLFVLGHSLTLLVATLAGWQVSPTAVDVVIALSVVYVGVLGMMGGPKNWRLTSFIVFGFGLVHGLGLSTRLQDIALPEDGLVIRILLFNVGLELGQLSFLLVVVGLWKLLTRAVPRALIVQQVAFGAMVLAGVFGAITSSSPTRRRSRKTTAPRSKSGSPPATSSSPPIPTPTRRSRSLLPRFGQP
jgi:hydrogenase/urease accessory protein HupE